MSVEHRPLQTTDESGVPHSRLERAVHDRPESPSTPCTAPTDHHAFERRLERTRLELQVAALERTLRQRERHRQALIEQYELVLADRASPANDGDGTPESAALGDSGSPSDADASADPDTLADVTDRSPLARVKRAIASRWR